MTDYLCDVPGLLHQKRRRTNQSVKCGYHLCAQRKGARDHALLLVCLQMSQRVSEVCSLKTSNIHWSHGRWVIRVKVKGGQGTDTAFAAGGQTRDRRLRPARRQSPAQLALR